MFRASELCICTQTWPQWYKVHSIRWNWRHTNDKGAAEAWTLTVSCNCCCCCCCCCCGSNARIFCNLLSTTRASWEVGDYLVWVDPTCNSEFLSRGPHLSSKLQPSPMNSPTGRLFVFVFVPHLFYLIQLSNRELILSKIFKFSHWRVALAIVIALSPQI